MPKLIYLLVFSCLLASCSEPVKSPPFTYREDEAISNPQGVPHDSATSYFPADASVNASQDSLSRRLGDCQQDSRSDSEYLFGFKAPVLSNYYLGHSIYRLLWMPSFRRPVLITVDLTESGGIMRTQLLSKPPGLIASSTKTEVEKQKAIQTFNEVYRLMRAGKRFPLDSIQLLANKNERLAELDYIEAPLVILTEKTVVLNQNQMHQFQELLAHADFWQLPTCERTLYLDGADYVLEVHEAHYYKVVRRQSPKETDRFFQCCKFLLNLSPAKPEPRQP